MSTLDVSNNTIVEIGRAFVDMPELKYLDLSHNHLPIVKEGAFRALPELISLHLDHNSITELQSDSFQASFLKFLCIYVLICLIIFYIRI